MGHSVFYLTDDLSSAIPAENLSPALSAVAIASDTSPPRVLSPTKKTNGVKYSRFIPVPGARGRSLVVRFCTAALAAQTISGTCTLRWVTVCDGSGWYYRPARVGALYLQRGAAHVDIYNNIEAILGAPDGNTGGDGGGGDYLANQQRFIKWVWTLPDVQVQAGDVLVFEVWWNSWTYPIIDVYYNGADETDYAYDSVSSLDYASRLTFSSPIEYYTPANQMKAYGDQFNHDFSPRLATWEQNVRGTKLTNVPHVLDGSGASVWDSDFNLIHSE